MILPPALSPYTTHADSSSWPACDFADCMSIAAWIGSGLEELGTVVFRGLPAFRTAQQVHTARAREERIHVHLLRQILFQEIQSRLPSPHAQWGAAFQVSYLWQAVGSEGQPGTSCYSSTRHRRLYGIYRFHRLIGRSETFHFSYSIDRIFTLGTPESVSYSYPKYSRGI